MTQWIYCPVCSTALGTNDLGYPTCSDGHFTKYPTPVAATLAFIRNGNDYLVIQRSHEPQKGHWDLPGGFMEPEENAYHTVVREIKEETGITDVTLIEPLGTYPSNYGGVESTLAIGFLFETNTRNVTLSEENSAYKWVPLSEIPELAFQDCRTALAELIAKNTL